MLYHCFRAAEDFRMTVAIRRANSNLSNDPNHACRGDRPTFSAVFFTKKGSVAKATDPDFLFSGSDPQILPRAKIPWRILPQSFLVQAVLGKQRLCDLVEHGQRHLLDLKRRMR